MAKIIDGKKIATKIRREIKEQAEAFQRERGRAPGLAVIIVGEDPASQLYVRNKHRACGECGFFSRVIALPEETSEKELLSLIGELNADASIDGILVQLPLPDHIDKTAVVEAIAPEKDVDVFHPANVGRLTVGDYLLTPCTPAGVLELLKRSKIALKGKKCVVVGRSNLVGKPLSLMMLEQNCTVTVCHSKTKNLKSECLAADILIVAVGKAKLIRGDMVKPGAVVVDVGINRDKNGQLCGDVDFAAVSNIASYITPVPGGVGPMTVTMLMKNTLTAAKSH